MFVTKKRILLALYRIEEQQQEILARLEKRDKAADAQKEPDKHTEEWIQEGIANILGYQAGKKRSDAE